MRKEGILTSYYSAWYGWVTKEDIGVKWDGYILNKYPIETETAFQGTDYPLARWADVLLMYAEADVRLNKTVSTSAIDCVNQVRHRAVFSAGRSANPARWRTFRQRKLHQSMIS